MIVSLTKNTTSEEYTINGKAVSLTTYTRKAKAMRTAVNKLAAIKRTSFKNGSLTIDEYELVIPHTA